MVEEQTAHTIRGGVLPAGKLWGDFNDAPEIFIAVQNPTIVTGTVPSPDAISVICDEALRALKAGRLE